MNGSEVAILNQYPKEKYNVLLAPTATQMTAWHKVVVCQVKIDPTVGNGDVYPQTGGLAFHKQALMRLADAAGIRFTGTDTHRHDDLSVTATAHGQMTKADGLEHDLIGTYTWDVPAREEQVRIDAKGTTPKAQDLLNVRKYAFMRAETGAMERLVRSALGLKSSYKKTELDKPFIVARVVTDMSQDPIMRIVTAMRLAGGKLGQEEITAIATAMSQQPQPQVQIDRGEPTKELEAGDGDDLLSETLTEKTVEPTTGDAWIERKPERDAFASWVHTKMGLSNEELLRALRVSSMRGWRKPMADTKQMIEDWIESQATVEQGELV